MINIKRRYNLKFNDVLSTDVGAVVATYPLIERIENKYSKHDILMKNGSEYQTESTYEEAEISVSFLFDIENEQRILDWLKLKDKNILNIQDKDGFDIYVDFVEITAIEQHNQKSKSIDVVFHCNPVMESTDYQTAIQNEYIDNRNGKLDLFPVIVIGEGNLRDDLPSSGNYVVEFRVRKVGGVSADCYVLFFVGDKYLKTKSGKPHILIDSKTDDVISGVKNVSDAYRQDCMKVMFTKDERQSMKIQSGERIYYSCNCYLNGATNVSKNITAYYRRRELI